VRRGRSPTSWHRSSEPATPAAAICRRPRASASPMWYGRRHARAVLVDAGPLIALIERTDAHHDRCVAALADIMEPLVTVWPAFTEAMYLVRGAERSQRALWGMIDSGGLDFAELTAHDTPRLRDLMVRYRDQP